MTEYVAYTFKSDLTLGQIRNRLNDAGPWKWNENYNDRWGDYNSSMPFGNEHCRANLRILFDTNLDLYAVNVGFESDLLDAQAQFETIRDTLFTRLLPAIGATELSETDTYE